MKSKILIVEDDFSTSTLIKSHLERAGHLVETAEDGNDALFVLKSTVIDLIITDVEMPNMDGVDLYKELKKSKKTCDIPVVILTSDEIFKKSFSELGVEGFIPKPFSPSTVLSTVENIVGSAAQVRKKFKVLVLGTNDYVMEEMENVLLQNHCTVKKVARGRDVIAQAIEMLPNIIVLDILPEDISNLEIIKSLKSLEILRDCHFVTYSYFTADQLGNTRNAEELKDIHESYPKDGPAKFIGRFNKESFIDCLREFGV